MYAFYWSSTTMVTVGYGDITPNNIYEVIFTTIAMYTASGLFSYAVSSISYLIVEMKKNEAEFSKEMRIVK